MNLFVGLFGYVYVSFSMYASLFDTYSVSQPQKIPLQKMFVSLFGFVYVSFSIYASLFDTYSVSQPQEIPLRKTTLKKNSTRAHEKKVRKLNSDKRDL